MYTITIYLVYHIMISYTYMAILLFLCETIFAFFVPRNNLFPLVIRTSSWTIVISTMYLRQILQCIIFHKTHVWWMSSSSASIPLLDVTAHCILSYYALFRFPLCRYKQKEIIWSVLYRLWDFCRICATPQLLWACFLIIWSTFGFLQGLFPSKPGFRRGYADLP